MVRLENVTSEDFVALAQGGRLHSLETKLVEWDACVNPYEEVVDIDDRDSRTSILAFTFVGNGFLHHMVRRIVSTLREVGQINESSTRKPCYPRNKSS